MNHEEASIPPHLGQSLCIRCIHHRRIMSGRGSMFILCKKNKVSQQFSKYPPQPVSTCIGFTPVDRYNP